MPGLIWMWLLYLFFAVYIRARSGIVMGSVEFALLAFGALGMMAACMAAGMAWTSFSGNMRIASSTAAVIGGPAFAFSGITFPLLAMPLPAQIFAQALPLTHYLRMQNQLLFTEVGHAAVSTQILVLWGMALGWFLLGLPLMCRRLKQPHFHGGHREEAFS